MSIQMSFLRYIIRNDVVKMHQAKVNVVMEWPYPQMFQELMSNLSSVEDSFWALGL